MNVDKKKMVDFKKDRKKNIFKGPLGGIFVLHISLFFGRNIFCVPFAMRANEEVKLRREKKKLFWHHL